jgi:hypothetical protein
MKTTTGWISHSRAALNECDVQAMTRVEREIELGGLVGLRDSLEEAEPASAGCRFRRAEDSRAAHSLSGTP